MKKNGDLFDDDAVLLHGTDCVRYNKYSSGLSFMSEGDGTCYVSGIGTCEDVDVVIPKVSPEGDSVTSIGHYAFECCDSLTSITIPDGVTDIGWHAFCCCSGIESITIPDSVTSIGNDAFYGTAYYKDSSNWENGVLYIGNHLIKAETSVSGSYDIKEGTKCIADDAFKGCFGLTSITIPNSVMGIGVFVFRGCAGLVSIVVDEKNTIYHSAGNCLIETASKALIAGCKKSVIPADGSVTSIVDHAFYCCTDLTSITIPDGVTSIGAWAFDGCNGLESITIPDGLTSIGIFAFNDCSGLKSITIPDGVTSIGMKAFFNCSSLESVTIPDSVRSIDDMAFLNCKSLTSITLPDGVTNIGKCVFDGTAYEEDSSNWENGVLYIGHHLIKAENGISGSCNIKEGTRCIADDAFPECDGLKSITIPDSVTSIGSYALWGCTGLASITLPDSVASIGKCVFDGTAYEEDSSNWENGVLYIGNHLIKAEESISGSYDIKEGTKCIVASAFTDCSGLTSITIPNSVKSIGDDAFSHCSSLKSITIPNSVKSIGDSAFWHCDDLTSITIPDSVTIISEAAFAHCRSLTSATIGNSVTSIGDYAFNSCDLTSITIPDSVTSIGDYAFAYCSDLANINFQGAIEQWNAISKGRDWNSHTASYTIHCTDGDI